MSITSNIFIKDLVERTKNFSGNRYTKSQNDIFTNIDSISDFAEFRKAVNDVNKKSAGRARTFSTCEYGAEGDFYGHRKAFFEYAGCADMKNQRFLLPYFEHGLNWYERCFPQIKQPSMHSFIFQGIYKNEMTHNVRKWNPVYNIGPYVLYAKPYYDEQKVLEMKKKLGKSVLVYPIHSYDGGTDAEYDRKTFVKNFMNQFKKDFDNVILSVYWKDVDDDTTKMFEAEGATLMCAGYREDFNFIRRLRTIMEISDATAGNHLGAHIGYSLALNRPHIIINNNAQSCELLLMNDDEKVVFNNTLNRFYDAFIQLDPTEEQQAERDFLYEKFWGGISCHKTPEEAKRIITLNDKLVKMSKGDCGKFESIVEGYVKGKIKNGDLDSSELITLKKAVGIGNE